VRGLTGLGAYLLHRDPHGDLVRQILAYLAAPRGVLLYSRFSREGFGGYSWVRWLTQDPKGEGDNSMPENQRPCQCVWAVRWGTRVIWLKLDCLNPNLQKG